ncbi:response regulator [Runella limosa]|uniref:response regulator n=1 Tax=Runella limosa TaxID=370978 RepID=UPI0003FD6349|nr:response regulator [Runella limosa]MCA0233892.1 response regulator [Bacteroidota bacterium]
MNKAITILICDDDEDDVYLLKSVMEECGIKNPIVYAKNGLEAIANLNSPALQNRIGLVLLDLNMPKMDGREVLKAVKSDGLLRRIPIVVLTTSSASEDIDNCYSMGANCFITKPASYENFNDTVKTLLKFWTQLSRLPVGAN